MKGWIYIPLRADTQFPTFSSKPTTQEARRKKKKKKKKILHLKDHRSKASLRQLSLSSLRSPSLTRSASPLTPRTSSTESLPALAAPLMTAPKSASLNPSRTPLVPRAPKARQFASTRSVRSAVRDVRGPDWDGSGRRGEERPMERR